MFIEQFAQAARRCLMPLGLAAACAQAAPVAAAEPGWPRTPYQYIVVRQDLRTVLQQFGDNLGLRVTLSDAVQGDVRGRLPLAPPRQFLDHLARLFNLDWYYDGISLCISASSESQTRLIALGGISFARLDDAMRRAGLLDGRTVLRPGPGDVAIAGGPPRYLALVQQTEAALADDVTEPAPSASGATLVIYRGAQTSKVKLP